MFDVRCSMFDVRCSMFDVRCSVFDVEYPSSIGAIPPYELRPAQLISPPPVPAYFMAVKRSKQSARRPRAATSDVLGNGATPKPPGRIPRQWKDHYRRLSETRDYLLSRQNDLVKDACEEQPAFSLHMADAGTDSFDRDFALSRLSAEQDAVYEIDEAMMRIRRGTYGICELTGKPIEAQRLEAIPWTRFCAEAETQLEKNGEVRRTRLAPREAIARGVQSENEAEGSTDDERLE
jgi:RNA polymerase-binding transcription factor DksA